MKKLVSLIALLLAMLLCLGSVAVAESTFYQLGDKMDDFTVTTYDGRSLTLSEVLKEKEAVLINFWATWCGPCRQEFPFMVEAYKQYADKVEIIALSVEPTDTNDVLAAFAAEMGLTFNIAQDTSGLSGRFDFSGIPTSIVVDRFGIICFQESGSLPDIGAFARLFDAFIGDNYTESVIQHGIPRAVPNVEPSSEAELNAALNAEGGTLVFSNGADIYDWPMIAGEKDGRSVVISSNTDVGDSQAWVSTAIDAKAGDAVAVTFKISSYGAIDMMHLYIDGEVVKSFGGEDGWMTYAHPFEADGNYTVSVCYLNDPSSSAGEDTLWVDSIAHLTGNAAAAALAANPVYPTTDEMYIKPLNESARQIIINDPTGMFNLYYGGECYIIPDDSISFEFGLTADYDPEAAVAFCNFNSAGGAMADCITDGRYIVTTGVDTYATTGYNESSVYLYPSLNDTDMTLSLTYFKDIENLEQFISKVTCDQAGNVLGSWDYADEVDQPVQSATRLTEVTYVIKYVDQNGNPVPGVMCQVCDETTCQVFVSDANGICEFTLAPYAWEIHTLMAPAGYTADTQIITIAPVEGGELVFTLTKN